MPNNFASRLHELRKEHGFTQALLAQQLNKADSTIRMWELGKNQPDHESLIHLARIFAVSTDYLLGQSDVRTTATRCKDNTLTVMQERPAVRTLLELTAALPDEDLAIMLRIARAFSQE